MRQVLFYLPFGIPVYGYGMMLFLAFVLCSWLAGRLARREGIDPKVLPDLGIWLFVTGILGARVTFVLQDWSAFAAEPVRMFYLWDGGLVLYGSIIGGAIGYLLAYRRFLAPAHISSWKMADVLAPCIALGVGLGRVGCLLTGCCYGNVAGASCPAIEFPLPSAPTQDMARLGYQTLAGFTVNDDLKVQQVEPASPAAQAGLRPGDVITAINNVDVSADKVEKAKDGQKRRISRYGLLSAGLTGAWPAGVRQLHLKVRRGDQPIELPPFLPESLPLHPTQIYETISMGLLLFLLLSFYPYKKHDGAVMVLLMLGYGLHRFLNEMLRIDNPPELLGLTFSQEVSLLVLAGGAVLAYFVFTRRPAPPPAPAVPAGATW